MHDDNCCLWYDITHTRTHIRARACVNAYFLYSINPFCFVCWIKKMILENGFPASDAACDVVVVVVTTHTCASVCECECYVRLHWSVYNHVKRSEWKFSSIDLSEYTWKSQSVKPFMWHGGKRRENYILTNYVKMFQMRFHKQSSSNWLLWVCVLYRVCTYVRIKYYRHEFKCYTTYHTHTHIV